MGPSRRGRGCPDDQLSFGGPAERPLSQWRPVPGTPTRTAGAAEQQDHLDVEVCIALLYTEDLHGAGGWRALCNGKVRLRGGGLRHFRKCTEQLAKSISSYLLAWCCMMHEEFV